MRLSPYLLLFALFGASPVLSAQLTIQIPLNYNFNGIVHAGEAAMPDAPAGFRSISDRALDFSAGVPTNPLLAPYSLVSTAGALDIVHVGNRDTVDNGNWMFDAAPDGDDIGVQPTWLTNVDQSTPQTTAISMPILLESTSTASFLIQVSNGGGSLDVRFGFQGGATSTATIGAGDWFGGVFTGTGGVDAAAPDADLSITEVTVDLSGSAGQSLTSITFQNPSNPVAGYAILAANVTADPRTLVLTPVPLGYNFNGIVHAGESGVPDDPMGFRAISDRGLDFTLGLPVDPLINRYSVVDQAGVLDCVHLGNRNTVAGGAHVFDAVANGDDVGTQPAWLANVDQTGPQTTTLATPLPILDTTSAEFIYQISNGGGAFDVSFGFQSGASTVATLIGGDWFGGTYPGAERVDLGSIGANLSVTEGTVDLSAFAGEMLESIAFSNRSNVDAGYAILACNLAAFELGVPYCSPTVANSTGAPGVISAEGSLVASMNNLVLSATSLPSSSFGFFITSRMRGFVANPAGSQGNLCLSGAIGRYVGPGQIQQSNAGGEFSLTLNLSQTPTPTGLVNVLPGETWNFQAWYRDSVSGMPTSNFTNGRELTFQ